MKSLFFVSSLFKMHFSMKVFVFFDLRLIEIWFLNDSVCFFWVSCLLKMDFSMRVLVFLVSAIVEDGAVFFLYEFKMFLRPEFLFQWKSLFFWSQAYWKLIFQWECLFFGPRHCGRRCCALFSYKFLEFLKPEFLFQWKSLFFLVSGILKIDFPAVGNILVLVVAFSN